jgi:hypothetical protein
MGKTHQRLRPTSHPAQQGPDTPRNARPRPDGCRRNYFPLPWRAFRANAALQNSSVARLAFLIPALVRLFAAPPPGSVRLA